MATHDQSKTPLPNAEGSGGLVSMLKALRELRIKKKLAESSLDNVKPTDDQGSPPAAKSHKLGPDEKLDDSSEIYDAHFSGFSRNDASSVTHSAMTSDLTFNNNTTIAEERERKQKQVFGYLEATDLERKIIRQVEYYFGDYNLPKDRYMLEKIDEFEGGWFDMDEMLTFKRLKALSEDRDLILQALAKSPNGIIQVQDWGQGKGRVRRNPSRPLPELSEARKISIQERTLFVWGFDRDTTTLDDLIDFFEGNFKGVCNIRQRTMRPTSEDVEAERQFLGSTFVTFETRQTAKEFFDNRHKLVFKGNQKLRVKWQKDFLNERCEFNDQLDLDVIDRNIYVYGFDKLDTQQDELSLFFRKFKGATAIRKRVYRFGSADSSWKFTGGVFVTFETPEIAKKFMTDHQKQPVLFNGDKLHLKWQRVFYEEKGKFKSELGQPTKGCQ